MRGVCEGCEHVRGVCEGCVHEGVCVRDVHIRGNMKGIHVRVCIL